jgi:hypothetical protein
MRQRRRESYGHRLELAKGESLQGIPCHCTDKAGNSHSVPLHIRRVALFLLRRHSGAAGSSLDAAIK